MDRFAFTIGQWELLHTFAGDRGDATVPSGCPSFVLLLGADIAVNGSGDVADAMVSPGKRFPLVSLGEVRITASVVVFCKIMSRKEAG